jgi:hypothetical protein
MNIAIKYGPLDKKQTQDIFNQRLRLYHSLGVVDDIEGLELYVKRELLSNEFDGRQIRNIVSSAVGLARAGPPGSKLTTDNLRQVVSNVAAFKRDLDFQMQKYLDEQNRKR